MERTARNHRYGPPEALIRHTPIGLNFVEVYFRRGTFETPALPAVLGNEGAGVVEAVGPGVNDVSIGDRWSTLTGRSARMPQCASIRRIASSAS
jgi:NADPH:quinone reductase-like Zn-dependent oxidoreductase